MMVTNNFDYLKYTELILNTPVFQFYHLILNFGKTEILNA